MLNWWEIQGALPGAVDQLLLWWAGGKVKKMEREIWSAIPLVVLWSIWKLRNECIFRSSTPNRAELCELIKTRVALWLRPQLKDFNFSINDFIFNLSQIRVCLGRTM